MRLALATAVAVLIFQSVAQAAFKADPGAICTGASDSPSRRIDPDKLLWELFKANNLSPNDLSIGRNDNSYVLRYQAILNPREYCSMHKCGKDRDESISIEARLVTAQGDLMNFWNSNIGGSRSDAKFLTSPRATNTLPNVVIEAFFREAKPAQALCVAEKKDDSKTPNKDQGSKPGEQIVGWRPEVRIRKGTSDLKVPQSSEKFAGVDRASLSYSRDYLVQTNTYDFEGVIGFATGPKTLDSSGIASLELIPYVGYTRQLVQGSSDPNATNVQNVKVGLIGNWIFPIAGYYQSWEFFPEFVHSLRSHASIVSGNAVWTPDFPFPGVGVKYHPYLGSPVSFLLKPQFKTVYSHVANDGGDPELRDSKDFMRIGPRLEAVWFVEEGPLAGLSYSAAYEFLKVFNGPRYSVPRFETKLAYTMPGQEFWALELRYVDGRNLDTLEEVRQLTLGVGLKY